MTAPQDPFRTPDGQPGQPAQPGAYGPPPGQPGLGQPGRPGDPFAGSQQVGGGPGQPPGGYGQTEGFSQPGGYGQPGYGAPYGPGSGGYGSPPVAKKNGFGVAALVLGILALLTGLFLGGIPFGIAAIVFGLLGRARAKRGEADNGGMALAGLVLGVLGLLLSIAVAIAGASFLSQNSGSLSDLTSCLQEAQGDSGAEAECQAEFEDELTN